MTEAWNLPSLSWTLFVKFDPESLRPWYLDHSSGVSIVCVRMATLLYHGLEVTMYAAVICGHVL